MTAQEIIAPLEASLSNLEAEQALLGAILARNEALAVITCNLRPEHFSEPLHARIFEATASMVRAGQTASPVTLKNYFSDDPTLKEIGGIVYLARLLGAATTIINVPEYARIVCDLAARREAVRRCQDAVIELQNLPVDVTAEQYCSTLSHDISKIAEGVGGRSRTTFSADMAVTAGIDDAAVAYQNDGRRPDAISTGLSALDAKIGGLVRGDLVVVGARPSMGKSAFGLQLMYNAALADIPALFISLEMRATQLTHRLLAMRTAVAFSRIAWGRFSEVEFGLIVEAGKLLRSMPFTIEDRASMTAAMVASVVARAKAKQPRLGLVVLDYLALVTPGDRYRGRKVDELAEISAECKRIPKQCDICMVALHQLSRSLEGRENKRPTLADLRDSGAIEQDADVVIFPFREGYYLARELEAAESGSSEYLELTDKLRKAGNTMELIVAKARQGAVGTAKVAADMPCNIIRDLDR